MEEFLIILFFILPLFPTIKMCASPKSKVCPKCGAKLQGDYEVCRVCGRHIGKKGSMEGFLLLYLLWLMIFFMVLLFLVAGVSWLFS